MTYIEVAHVYGPVPSRRLGMSIGINNIPPKVCSYSCIYCQLGRTKDFETRRRKFYSPRRIFEEVEKQVASVETSGKILDHLTFVPDGEPTLDTDLGKEIEMVRDLGYPVAVITNSSLIDIEDVRDDLLGADLVSVKVDSIHGETWSKINRPHGSLILGDILEGVQKFADQFDNDLITETMLVKGMNDVDMELERISEFIKDLGPNIAYLTVPIRPPTEKWVETPDDDGVILALKIFSGKNIRTASLTEREYGDFFFTGDVRGDILAITSVHPMRKDSIQGILDRSGESWEIVNEMVDDRQLSILDHMGVEFYRRRI